MKHIVKQSRNEERRARYKQLASETDKDHRNAELSAALGTETERTEVHEVTDESTSEEGKVRRKVRKVKTIAPMSVSSAPGSGNESRAAKRARMRAARTRQVKDEKHPLGECGNTGCILCHGSAEQVRALLQRQKDAFKHSPEYRKAKALERKKGKSARQWSKEYSRAVESAAGGHSNA